MIEFYNKNQLFIYNIKTRHKMYDLQNRIIAVYQQSRISQKLPFSIRPFLIFSPISPLFKPKINSNTNILTPKTDPIKIIQNQKKALENPLRDKNDQGLIKNTCSWAEESQKHKKGNFIAKAKNSFRGSDVDIN